MQGNQQEQQTVATKPINPAKVYMLGYRDIVARCEALIRRRDKHLRDVGRYDDAWNRATKATSRLRAVAISGTGMHDGMANAVLDMIRLEATAHQGDGTDDETDALNAAITHAAEALKVRLTLIDRLTDGRYKTVMVMRDVEGAPWEKIIRMCDRADSGIDRRERQVFRLHGRALEEIRAMLENGSS